MDEDASTGHVTMQMSRSNTADAVASALQSTLAQLMRPAGPPHTTFGERHPTADRFVRAPLFEGIIASVIIVNCVTIGIEVNTIVEQPEPWVDSLLKLLEHIFTAFFLAEFILRMLFLGWRIYVPMSGGPVSRSDACYNLMDAFLVWFTGVLFIWILEPLKVNMASLRILTAFRAFRLFRFVRVVRKLPLFKEVVMLIEGLTDSARTLFWTIVVLVFITYIFAVFGVVLISTEVESMLKEATTSEDIDTLGQLMEEVGGVDNWMYTLIQVLTLDSWNSITRPLVKYMQWSWIFFYGYIAVAVVVLMNLVTAVIVENALASSAKDAEQQLAIKQVKEKKTFSKVQYLFDTMDSNHNGILTYDEFCEAIEKPQVTKQLECLAFSPDECKVLYHLLDQGNSQLSVQEFFQGLQHMKGSAHAKDVFILSKKLDQMTVAIQQVAVEVTADNRDLSGILGVALPDRPGTIVQRTEQAVMEARRRSRSGGLQRAAAAAPASPAGTWATEERGKVAPPNVGIGKRLERIMSGMESLRQDVNNQMQQMATRLDRVEITTASSAQGLATLSLSSSAQSAAQSAWRRRSAGVRAFEGGGGKELYTPCQGLF